MVVTYTRGEPSEYIIRHNEIFVLTERYKEIEEVEIKEKQGDYEYSVTPQPLNWDIEPEKTFDKHFWIPLLFFLAFLNIVFFLIFN